MVSIAQESLSPIRRLLLTRPEGKNEALQRQLTALGFEIQIMPLLEQVPLALDATRVHRLRAADQYSLLISISAFASTRFCDVLTQYKLPWPQQARCFAVGASAAAPWRALPVSVTTPDPACSEALLARLPERLEGERVLLVKGAGGRTLLAQALRRRGAEVTPLALYRRQGATALRNAKSEAVLSAILQADAILITSGAAFEVLKTLVPHISELKKKLYMVPSVRVGQLLDQAHCHHWQASGGADDRAIIALLSTMALRAAAKPDMLTPQ